MTSQLSARTETLLWSLAVIFLVVLIAIGTLSPWPAANEKLKTIGSGPYVPLSFAYRSHTSESTTHTHRSQTYVVASQIGKSLSTYRVVSDDEVVTVEEVKFGLLYGTLFLVAFLAGIIWRLRRLRGR